MPESPLSQVILAWKSLDSRPYERSPRWYLIGGILLIGLAAYGLFYHSWTTALVAILIGGVYFMTRNVKPREISVQITGIGIQIDNNLIPWSNCKDFWILIPIPPKNSKQNISTGMIELHISTQKALQGEVVVFLNDIDPAEVRQTLLTFLPERSGMEERFLDSLAKIFKL